MRKILNALIYVAALALAVWYFGSESEEPLSSGASRQKAHLCSLAGDVHAFQLEKAREEGLVVEDSVNPDTGAYVFVVEETLWQAIDSDAQEVIGIAGWCRVASEDGKGVALVLGRRSHDQLGIVVDGQYRIGAVNGVN